MNLQSEFTDHEAVRSELAEFVKNHTTGTPDKPNGTLAISNPDPIWMVGKALAKQHEDIIKRLLEERTNINDALVDLGYEDDPTPEKPKRGRPAGSRNRKAKAEVTA